MGDFHDVASIEKRLRTAAKRLHELAPMVGVARQVRAYDSDRRKNLLAKYMVPALKAGESATAAEAHARADAGYQAELQKLSEQLQDAEQTLSANEAENASWESARSLLSFQKETMKNMPE